MMKQKSIIILLIGLCFISTVSIDNATPKQPMKLRALPAEIRIGGVFPIVQRPDAGRDRRDAFLMAVAEINNQTGTERILPEGVKLVPRVLDDNNDATGGIAAAQALIGWEADIVIGSSSSSVSMAMATILTPYKIPQISYASSSPALSDRERYPYFMRISSSVNDQGIALADLIAVFGWTRGAIICTTDSYGTSYPEIVRTEFEAAGGKILSFQKFDPGAANADAQILAIKDKDPEFILGHFIVQDAAIAMRSAIDLSLIDIPWIITDGWATTGIFGKGADIKELMQLSIGTNFAPFIGPRYSAFTNSWFDPAWAYLEGPKYSQDTEIIFNSYAPLAYDSVFVAAKGLAAAGTTEGDSLLVALYDVTHEGASGSIKFNELGEVTGLYEYVQCQGEIFVPFGSWQDSATLNPVTITLPDDSVWNIIDNKATCVANCLDEITEKSVSEVHPPSVIGFIPLETLLFSFVVFLILTVVYKHKHSSAL
ncbi:MAG: ABC transporter substrate-binding protein [Promethearchaeota archaeon]